MAARFRLELVAFLTGAAVMTLELVGSRIFAPYLGTSIYVWTALISVILASLSLGYFLGGRMADGTRSTDLLGRVLCEASALVAIAALVHRPLLTTLPSLLDDLRTSAIAAAMLLFGPPGVLLGMVSPYCARLCISDINGSGRVIGTFSGLSAAGSIAGTIMTGFFLLAWLGCVQMLLAVAAVLLVCAVLAYRPDHVRENARRLIATALLAVVSSAVLMHSAGTGEIDIDTAYGRIRVRDMYLAENGQEPVRMMLTDPFGYQSSMLPHRPEQVVYIVAKAFRLSEHFRPGARKVLLIGGAGYIHPRDFLLRNPGASVTVVEIDPQATEIARRYFGLAVDPRLSILHEDGRTFLNRSNERFDVIFNDAFGGGLSIPFQLASVEAVRAMSRSLDPQGLVMTNVISAARGRGARFLAALSRTYREVFPEVRVFALKDLPVTEPQNFVLVALKDPALLVLESSNPEFAALLSRCVEPSSDTPAHALTDDYAPIDELLAPVVELYAARNAASRAPDQGGALRPRSRPIAAGGT